MKKTKNLHELYQSLNFSYERRRRREKQLLIIELGSERACVSCWQADSCLWQKEFALEARRDEGKAEEKKWWQELAEKLTEAFLWTGVENMAATLLILSGELVFGEQIALPAMSPRELRQAVRWEAEALVPWQPGSYTLAFSLRAKNEEHDRTGEQDGEAEEAFDLWAWRHEDCERAEEIFSRLRLHLQGILVGMARENAHQAWYRGLSFREENLQPQCCTWQQRTRQMARSSYPKIFFLGCVLFSLLIYGGAKGGYYLAGRKLQETEQELEQLQIWEQRMEKSRRLDNALAEYARLEKKVEADASHASRNLQQLGQQLGRECWLQVLKGERKSGEWQAEGACYRAENLNRLLDRLEAVPNFSQARLSSSRQQEEGLAFSIRMKVQG